jgi:DNA end-binding protein Ku
MRSMWKGAIGFGLVSIPVKLYAATDEHSVSLHQVHAEDGGRIRMRRVCERCGKEVAYADIAKGYQDDAGRVAVLTDADMAELPLPSKKLIDVVAFVDAERIDPLTLSRAYYVGAEPAAAKPYVLLRDALAGSGRAAVTKIALRTRESLALLRVHDDVLVLHTMYWPDEVRAPEGLAPPENLSVRPQELRMAESLMDTLSEDFDLTAMHDDYRHALEELVAARLEGEPVPEVAETAPAPANVIDLMSALQASIDARTPSAAAGPEKEEAAARESPKSPEKEEASRKTPGRKKTAAKKTAGKRTAAKEPAAKKAAPKKKAASRKRAG